MSNSTQSSTKAEYGKVYTFDENTILEFPDFTITYMVITQKEFEAYGRSFTYHDFLVTDHSGNQQKIDWSSGLGEISPTFFTVGNIAFLLEMQGSMVANVKLADNEIVVSRRNSYKF
jgi:hypothetical protein